jgi:chromosome segregation ATPase
MAQHSLNTHLATVAQEHQALAQGHQRIAAGLVAVSNTLPGAPDDALQQILAAVQHVQQRQQGQEQQLQQLQQGQQQVLQGQQQVLQGQQHALQQAARTEERMNIRLANHNKPSRAILVSMPDANGVVPPVNLIPNTGDGIAALPENQLNQALDFYGLAVNDGMPEKRTRLLIHLGVAYAM